MRGGSATKQSRCLRRCKQRDCHASFAKPLSARNDKGDGCHCEEALRRSNLAVSGVVDSEIATPRSQSLTRLAMTKGTAVIARSLATKQSCSPRRCRQRDCHASFAKPLSARNDKGDGCHCEEALRRSNLAVSGVVDSERCATTASAVLLQRDCLVRGISSIGRSYLPVWTQDAFNLFFGGGNFFRLGCVYTWGVEYARKITL